MNRAILVFLSLISASLLTQYSDSDRLRDLTKSVPQLPVDRFELKLNPPLPLEGISAVTADKRGNIYVIHRPANGDPVSLDTEFNVVKIDPVSGKMLGRFEVRAHELTVAPDGALLPATRGSQLLLFRLRK